MSICITAGSAVCREIASLPGTVGVSTVAWETKSASDLNSVLSEYIMRKESIIITILAILCQHRHDIQLGNYNYAESGSRSLSCGIYNYIFKHKNTDTVCVCEREERRGREGGREGESEGRREGERKGGREGEHNCFEL